MQTMAVIKHLDVMDHITSRVAPITVEHSGRPFGFQTVKETLRNSIIPAIALSTHTADRPIAFQKFLVITTGILTATVGVMNQSLSRLPPPISHRKSFRGKRCLHVLAHRPADNFSRVQVDDHSQIQPSFHGPQIGNVAAPHSIGSNHLKISIQKIRGYGQVMLTIRRYSEFLRRSTDTPAFLIRLRARYLPTWCPCKRSLSDVLREP